MSTFPRVQPLGDSAIVVAFGDQINRAMNDRVYGLVAVLDADRPDGVVEWVPTYAALIVHYNPVTVTYDGLAQW